MPSRNSVEKDWDAASLAPNDTGCLSNNFSAIASRPAYQHAIRPRRLRPVQRRGQKGKDMVASLGPAPKWDNRSQRTLADERPASGRLTPPRTTSPRAKKR